MQVSNKIIVVTGAGSGIGRELTFQLLKKQAKVIGVDIDANSLAETQQLASVGDDRFKGFTLAISNKEKVESFAKDVIQEFGAIDGIINNAGIIQHFIPVNDLGFDQINRVMNVNFFGTVYLTKAFLPHFFATSRSAYCEYFKYGWLSTRSRSNDLWGCKGCGEAVY